MYIRLGSIIVNTAQLVHARVLDGDEVVLVMSTGAEIELDAAAGAKFLEALPVYEPVEGGY